MSTVYIYALVDPRSGAVRYVGKTNDPERRYAQHCRTSNNRSSTHRANWITSLLGGGLSPDMEVLEACDRADWKDRERHWIDFYKSEGANLTNGTDGGDEPPEAFDRSGLTHDLLHEKRRMLRMSIRQCERLGVSPEGIEKGRRALRLLRRYEDRHGRPALLQRLEARS